MFETWFTNKCTAYVDENGRCLTGAALEAAKSNPQARRCGHLVKTRAKFCSKCGAPAPGSWWRCGGCGEWIGIESLTCPHCGRRQNVNTRLDLADGLWQKGDGVFAQRFDALEVARMMPRGLSVQEGQAAILLSGGMVTEVLPSGHYGLEKIAAQKEYQATGAAKSFVMIDLAEVALPVEVADLHTKDNFDVSLTFVAVVAFDPEHPVEFLTNVMGTREIVEGTERDAFTLGYDGLARYLLNDIDSAVRRFCEQHTVEELYSGPVLRLELEAAIRAALEASLVAAGLMFRRVREVDFRGVAFERLRKTAGEIEVKRRELEFQLQAEEYAQAGTRRKAKNALELEEYLKDLAQEKQVSAVRRNQELERIAAQWKLEQATAEQDAQEMFEVRDAAHEEKLKGIAQQGELDRRRKEHDELMRQKVAEQEAAAKIGKIQLEVNRLKMEAEVAETKMYQEIRLANERAEQEMELKRVESYKGVSLATLAAVVDDPIRAERIAKLASQEIQAGMTPELLLAVAAARGDEAASRALASLSGDQLAWVEQSKRENQELYQQMVKMNQETFNKTVEIMGAALAKPAAPQPINVIR